MTELFTAQIERVAQELVRRRHGVALTGAGISADSGIPDFRSSGGLWERFDPLEYATLEAFRANPQRVWEMLFELGELLGAALPNPGHVSLSRLEAIGVLDGVITQNVDNLHQAAGSRQVVEFHGNGRRLRCLRCNALIDARDEAVRAAERSRRPPVCRCGQVLKPDVVLFGELIPAQLLDQAAAMVAGSKVMLVVGTSASIAPASGLPLMAQRQGALLVELNLTPTELTPLCDVVVHASASESLAALARRVEQLITQESLP